MSEKIEWEKYKGYEFYLMWSSSENVFYYEGKRKGEPDVYFKHNSGRLVLIDGGLLPKDLMRKKHNE